MKRWISGLLAVALAPALVSELHFNAQGHRLNYFRTPERRNLDYLRDTAGEMGAQAGGVGLAVDDIGHGRASPGADPGAGSGRRAAS